MAATPPAEDDYRAVRERSRTVWSTGEYEPTSRQLESAAIALIEALGVGAADRVLDVAAGHGNCALAAARAGATVIASDFSPMMVQRGRDRTQRTHAQVAWVQADATRLPFADAAFGCVTSTFGAVFVPEHDDMAAELVRVTAYGGRVALTSWVADGRVARSQRLTREYLPPMQGSAPDPYLWGDPDYVRSRFEALQCDVRITPRLITLHYASWDAWREEGAAHGMAVLARELLGPERYEEMRERHREIIAEDVRTTPDGAIDYDLQYLEIVATRTTRGG